MHAAWPAISRALQGSGLSPAELRLAYTVSRLKRVIRSSSNLANRVGCRAFACGWPRRTIWDRPTTEFVAEGAFADPVSCRTALQKQTTSLGR